LQARRHLTLKNYWVFLSPVHRYISSYFHVKSEYETYCEGEPIFLEEILLE